jgi:hypothetical protein
VALVLILSLFLAAGGGADTEGALCGFFMIGSLAAFVISAGYVENRALQRDLANATVTVICGSVGTDKETGSRGGSLYYLRVGDHKFAITKRQYRFFEGKALGSYKAYYAPKSNTLLALEPSDLPGKSTRDKLGRFDPPPHL